jgi:host factor-I protein
MATKGNSVQDEFLDKAIANRIPVRVLLISGKDLRGIIKASDTFTVALDIGNGTDLLVYKSAIGVIGPASKPGD